MTLTLVLTFEITMKFLIFQYLILTISGEKIPFEKGHFPHLWEQKPVCWKNVSCSKKTSTLKLCIFRYLFTHSKMIETYYLTKKDILSLVQVHIKLIPSNNRLLNSGTERRGGWKSPKDDVCLLYYTFLLQRWRPSGPVPVKKGQLSPVGHTWVDLNSGFLFFRGNCQEVSSVLFSV
jgi:hypothetical protein